VKILLYGINYEPELTGIGKYSGEMAHWLKKNKHDVRVVTAPPYYPEWRVQVGYSKYIWTSASENGIQVVRCPLFVPERPVALTRILHLLSFCLSSIPALLSQSFWRPQIVILVVPTLFSALQAWVFARLVGAKVVIHIQDYELDAMLGLGLGTQSVGVLKRVAFAIERFILRRFDKVSTISTGMLERGVSKGVDREKMVLFPNWVETKRFQGISRDPSFFLGLGIPAGKRIVLYSGNIGEKQGLEVVLDSAEAMLQDNSLWFVIVGDGAAKVRLEQDAYSRGLTNISFHPLQPLESLPVMLASADCHLVVQRKGAADAVLPSKLTNILAVGGHSVITAEPETTLGRLCTDYPGIAECVEPENSAALTSGIRRVLSAVNVNEVATRYAIEALDQENIMRAYLDVLEDMVTAR
jgi:colanic acid biosynthesis glycosyl transferase WcaI